MRRKFALLGGLLLSLTTLPTAATIAAPSSEVQAFIDGMSKRHQFDRQRLTELMESARLRQDILDAISSPAEAKPWYKYRPIFVTNSRIRQGIEFWRQHKETLQAASEKYGVPEEIIVAIIGVETRYGRHAGGYRVLDALYTLGFNYPPRGSFFRSELEQFLLLSREENLDPAQPKGSYAGAMGQPQFISSSYRRYAIDFDGDGQRDLWNNPADAIGSVANYFKRHGWRPGEAVTTRAKVEGNQHEQALDQGLKPKHSLYRLQQLGVSPVDILPETRLATLLKLDGEKAPEYWLGLHNFYVITRYNHSALYAMAVYQLSQEIKTRMESRG